MIKRAHRLQQIQQRLQFPLRIALEHGQHLGSRSRRLRQNCTNGTRHFRRQSASHRRQAAIDGHGVALGDSTLVGDDLAAGRLVKPFELALRSPAQFAYHLITRRDTAERPMTKAFRNWIIAEAAASQG